MLYSTSQMTRRILNELSATDILKFVRKQEQAIKKLKREIETLKTGAKTKDLREKVNICLFPKNIEKIFLKQVLLNSLFFKTRNLV